MRVALLDVNVLLALMEASHVHHDIAKDWFQKNVQSGWSTCPLTENGFVRIACNPNYSSMHLRHADVIKILEQLKYNCTDTHYFWADSFSLTDRTIFRPEFITGHKQITDIYLLGLCQLNGGTLIACDCTVRTDAIIHPHRDLIQILTQRNWV